MLQRWIVPPVQGLIEPAIAPEIFVNEQPAVEWLGDGNVCFYLPRRQMTFDGAEITQPILAAKIVQPIARLPLVLAVLAHCLNWKPDAPQCDGPPRPFRPHIVG